MRMAVTADIHLGITSGDVVAEMLDRIVSSSADALVVAGDVGEPLGNFRKCLSLLSATGLPVGVLAGNHDLWSTHGRYTSVDLFEGLLPAACRDAGVVWLEQDDLRLPSGVAVCGSIAWYDYSHFRPEEQARIARRKRELNNDSRYIDWPHTDNGFAELCRERLLRRLGALEQDSGVRSVILVTHVPVFEVQQVLLPSDNPDSKWYFGNNMTGDAVLGSNLRKLRWVVSGHTHRGVAPRPVPGCVTEPSIHTATVGSDYYIPDFVSIEL